MDFDKQMIAKKYARACVSLYPTIVNKEQLVRLFDLRSYLKKHNNSLFYASLGIIDDKIVAKNFINLFRNFAIDENLDNLIELLIVHQRLFLLRAVIRQLELIIKQKLSIEEFTISSSHELTKDEVQNIVYALKNRLNSDIIYKTNVDESLIAGVKVYSSSWLYDYSIKERLKALYSRD